MIERTLRTMTLPGPKAKEYLERDRAVTSPSYARDYPFVMDHGRGSEAWDVDGNRFVDFAAGIAVCSTGHSHPAVVAAIKQQVEQFIHISADYYHPKWIELGERLDLIAPFSEGAKTFMTNSGAESVEAAIKLARHHTGRQQFIGFFGGFHGRTMGALAFTSSKPLYRSGFLPLMGGVTHVPYPDPYRPWLHTGRSDYGEAVVDYIDKVVLARSVPPDDCAAVLVEPIQGEGGYIVPPDGFFPALRRLCDKYGILLIVDEVQSGVGRTGKWWAVEHWGVEPDMVCAAKGIASGLPLGATIARDSVMDWPTGAHGNTFGGNPVSCSAALVTLDLIEHGMMQNAAEMGQYTLDALSEIAVRHPSIGQVRGKGLMIGAEFVTDRKTKQPAKKLRDRIVHKAFSHGLLLLGCGESVIRFAPALNIPRDLIDEGLEAFEASVSEAEAEGLD
ncbi:MAG TPA: acetyl ornithine aminotransferase family protein [Anaerolineales bacterium]|nr:acetyl ornithine aminotransferase family protein [Anaerolineales bacterium]